MKKFSIFCLAFIICGLYVGYSKQKNDYKSTIELLLTGACNNLLFVDFGAHTSSIDVKATDDNVFVGSETRFDFKNNILTSYIEGRSFVYFNDSAPQEITCKATLLPIYKTNRTITKDTKIRFNFIGPRFLPNSYKSKLANSKTTLTVNEIDDRSGLEAFLEITKKPQFMFYGVIPI